jgi:SAM-dependent methyltransferase
MNPRFSHSELYQFYKSDYKRIYCGSETPKIANIKEQQSRASNFSEFIKSSKSKIESHLDVGCSAGMLLDRVRIDLDGKQSVGVEPSDEHREYVARKGFNVYSTYAEMKQAVKERFDLVTMSHVLEHMADPVDFLVKIREESVSSCGLLVLEVPNLFAHECYEIAHLFAFSKKTIVNVCRAAGFKVVEIVNHGLPRRNRNSRRYIMVKAVPDQRKNDCRTIRKNHRNWVKLQRFVGRAVEGYSLLELFLRTPRFISRRVL